MNEESLKYFYRRLNIKYIYLVFFLFYYSCDYKSDNKQSTTASSSNQELTGNFGQSFELIENSGFIGIADLNSYKSYLSEEWNYEDLKKHIHEQSKENKILLWPTGEGGNWKILITSNEIPNNLNWHSFELNSINITNEKVHLVNYETLSMASQNKNITLPEKHLSDKYFKLKNGVYVVSFIHLNDQDNPKYLKNYDYLIHFENSTAIKQNDEKKH